MYSHLRALFLIQIAVLSHGSEFGTEQPIERKERALLFPKASTLGVSFGVGRHPK